MKEFFKKNILTILFLLLAGLLFVLWGRLTLAEFSKTVMTENLYTTKDRVESLNAFGWQVDETSETEEKVYIPKLFDAVWERYNEIQKMSGFNLLPYAGESAVRYTYRAKNFPGMEEAEVFVNILIYKDTLIGGDCMTVALGGFMLPLDIRKLD